VSSRPAKKSVAKKVSSRPSPKAVAKKPALRPTEKRAAKPSAPPAAKGGARRIERELWLRATPDVAWRLWTTEAGLESWLVKSVEKLDARADGVMLASMDCEGEAHPIENGIVALEPGRRLVLDWERTAEWAGTRVEVGFAEE